MTRAANNSAGWARLAAVLLLAAGAAVCGLRAQAQSAAATGDKSSATAASAAGEPLDYLVAIVNQDVILESDVEEEMRLSAFEPYQTQTKESPRSAALDRLINRTLILEQERLQPQAPVSDADARAQIQELRRTIPACAEYKCETEAGWQRFLTEHDFNERELETLWRERIEVLRFIELRFQSGIRITPEQIADFYQKTLLPQYAGQKAPPLEQVSARIEEVLLQRQVTVLLDEWLKSLRAQGIVRTLQPGEETP
jgi:parvulin-like peptidyl-prolyl isomerase